jgi:hypothetical protein
MKILVKAFITASLLLFCVSLTGFGSEFLWGFLKPLSALLFVAFFITNLLANEYAKYDEEHAYRMALAKESAPQRQRSCITLAEPSGQPVYELQGHKA